MADRTTGEGVTFVVATTVVGAVGGVVDASVVTTSAVVGAVGEVVDELADELVASDVIVFAVDRPGASDVGMLIVVTELGSIMRALRGDEEQDTSSPTAPSSRRALFTPGTT